MGRDNKQQFARPFAEMIARDHRPNCQGMDTEKFWNDNPNTEVCDGCKCRCRCLCYALFAPELTGVWGGLTSTIRENFRRHIFHKGNTWPL